MPPHPRRRATSVYLAAAMLTVLCALVLARRIAKRAITSAEPEAIPRSTSVINSPPTSTKNPFFGGIPLRGSEGVQALAFVDDLLIGATPSEGRSKILRWREPSDPPELLETLGQVHAMVGAPHGPLLALALVDDARVRLALVVIDVHTGALSILERDEVGIGEPSVVAADDKRIPVWSADGINVTLAPSASDTKPIDVPSRWPTSALWALRSDGQAAVLRNEQGAAIFVH